MSSTPPRPAAPEPPGKSEGPRSLYSVNPVRRWLFGKPVQTEHEEHVRLRKLIALPIFSSDAISSVAYATQEILLVLCTAGIWLSHPGEYRVLNIGITAAIVGLLAIVATSYRQTIYAYPSGGGSYIVSRENLGLTPGLIAAAALLIDYVMTVSVSVASGIQNTVGTPLAQQFGLQNFDVHLCVLAVAFITWLNLRGMKEVGFWFAIPTYLFIGLILLMLAVGLAGPLVGWRPELGQIATEISKARSHPPSHEGAIGSLSGLLLIGLVLRAFANGCSAMTGTEAISNAVPAFRRPESRNAARTLMTMATVLGTLFLGISWLSSHLGVVYLNYAAHDTSPAVIDQLSGAVFGRHGAFWQQGLYYATQLSTLLILVLAANTSFAGFPRLAAILARDRFMPRQLANQGDKLVYGNGILLLAVFAVIIIAVFHGNVDRMIPLYAVGVFTAFTLSQSGMVIHWIRLRDSGWQLRALVNGFGALCTGVVAIVIISEKLLEGAWIVLILGAVLVTTFLLVARHYDAIRRALSIQNYHPDTDPYNNSVLLLVPSLHRGVFPALRYARALSADCRAIHIEIDPEQTPRLRREWERYVGDDVPLVILPSPFRSLIGPLLAYLDQVQKELPDNPVTVVLPEFVPGKWWYSLLHNANGFLIKYYLGQRPGVVTANIRYFINARGRTGMGVEAPMRNGQG